MKIDSWEAIAAACECSRGTVLARRRKQGAPQQQTIRAWKRYFKRHALRRPDPALYAMKCQKLQLEIDKAAEHLQMLERENEKQKRDYAEWEKTFYRKDDFRDFIKLMRDTLAGGLSAIKTIPGMTPECHTAVSKEVARFDETLKARHPKIAAELSVQASQK